MISEVGFDYDSDESTVVKADPIWNGKEVHLFAFEDKDDSKSVRVFKGFTAGFPPGMRTVLRETNGMPTWFIKAPIETLTKKTPVNIASWR